MHSQNYMYVYFLSIHCSYALCNGQTHESFWYYLCKDIGFTLLHISQSHISSMMYSLLKQK